MDFNIPSHVTAKTILRAKRLYDNAVKLDVWPGHVRWGDDTLKGSDYLFFIFMNKYNHFLVIYCSPGGYFIEFDSDDDNGNVHTEFSMVKNIRHQLGKIKRAGFHDCEHIKRENSG